MLCLFLDGVDQKMKKILFVISSFGRGGAEMALIELLRSLDPEQAEVSLFVLLSQGEMASALPSYVRLLNTDYDGSSVHDKAGRRKLVKRAIRCLWRRGTAVRLIPYVLANLWDMLRHGPFRPGMLAGRVLSDGSPRLDGEYDLAVGWLEGSSTYYAADHVKAARKAAFLHTDYVMNGYSRQQDLDCYSRMDKIFAVSDSVRSRFLEVYPEYAPRLEVFHNILDVSGIRRKALLPGGFTDVYEGVRLLTVARLSPPKALEVSVEALKLLKDAGGRFRWYVLGEGDQRERLERKIRALGLEEDFILCGAVDNPYPYYAQADLYIHATRFEGKSIAIQEAQILGCTILTSDCGGNRETVSDGVDGRLCPLTPEGVRDGIVWLTEHPEEGAAYAAAAAQKWQDQSAGPGKLLALIED